MSRAGWGPLTFDLWASFSSSSSSSPSSSGKLLGKAPDVSVYQQCELMSMMLTLALAGRKTKKFRTSVRPMLAPAAKRVSSSVEFTEKTFKREQVWDENQGTLKLLRLLRIPDGSSWEPGGPWSRQGV